MIRERVYLRTNGESFYFIFYLLAVMVRAFSSGGVSELLFVVVPRILISVASLVVKHRL